MSVIVCHSYLVQFDNLHRLRSKISIIEGFDLSAYQSTVEQVEGSVVTKVAQMQHCSCRLLIKLQIFPSQVVTFDHEPFT